MQMRKFQLPKSRKIYVYDPLTKRMVERDSRPKPIEGDPATGENDQAERGEGLETELSADNK